MRRSATSSSRSRSRISTRSPASSGTRMPRAARRVYLDSAATTFLDPRVIDVMAEVARKQLGNASSVHALGVEAATAVERARATIAASLGAGCDEIVFTSCGTEANALAILGAC